MLRTIVHLLLFFISLSAFAAEDFCCKDSNWQQEMLQRFQTEKNRTDFSFPAGLFRKMCDACEYDMQNLRCQCATNSEVMPELTTELNVSHCEHIYANSRSELVCGDNWR